MKRAEVEREIERQITLAREAETPDSWITYLIRDPRRRDLRGNPAGWPIYVGQTDEFGKRVRSHLRKSEKSARKGKGVKFRLRELLHAGVVPTFEPLDRQPSRLRSLLSETNYARLCRSRGYDIANKTTLQNVAGPPVTRADLPLRWFWRFTLKQAAQDDIELAFVCRDCSASACFPASAFENVADPPRELRDIRDNEALCGSPCTFCGVKGTRRITLKLA